MRQRKIITQPPAPEPLYSITFHGYYGCFSIAEKQLQFISNIFEVNKISFIVTITLKNRNRYTFDNIDDFLKWLRPIKSPISSISFTTLEEDDDSRILIILSNEQYEAPFYWEIAAAPAIENDFNDALSSTMFETKTIYSNIFPRKPLRDINIMLILMVASSASLVYFFVYFLSIINRRPIEGSLEYKSVDGKIYKVLDLYPTGELSTSELMHPYFALASLVLLLVLIYYIMKWACPPFLFNVGSNKKHVDQVIFIQKIVFGMGILSILTSVIAGYITATFPL